MIKQENNMLDSYFSLEGLVHKLFGYQEDWRKFPIFDRRNVSWVLRTQDGENVIVIRDEPLTEKILTSGAYEEYDVFNHRHLPKSVYRADNFTLITADTGFDCNIGLFIFANEKYVKDAETWALYEGAV